MVLSGPGLENDRFNWGMSLQTREKTKLGAPALAHLHRPVIASPYAPVGLKTKTLENRKNGKRSKQSSDLRSRLKADLRKETVSIAHRQLSNTVRKPMIDR